MLTCLNVKYLHPHPNNPRKALGDLTELAESIKTNGVLQNLTVVPYIDAATQQLHEGRYTVVIGHRRLAAAEMAGLTEVPCTIAEMSEQTQLATMLLENIQRSDLTILEQAEGFQMMIGLGETVAGISRITGFSESTVRHRVKLMELDKKKFSAAVERGGTIADYIALEQLKDQKHKSKALEAIGTRDFQWTLKQLLEEEELPVRKEALKAFLKDWAKPLKQQPNGLSYEKCFHRYQYEDYKKPKDAADAEYFYKDDGYGITLYKTAPPPEKKAKSPEEKAYDKRENQLKAIARRAYDLRYTFVKEYGAAKKYASEIHLLVFRRLTQYSHADLNNILKLLDIEKPEGEDYKSEVQEAKRALIFERYQKQPEKTMLLTAYACFEDKPSNDYYDAQSWRLEIKHAANSSLDTLYDTLITLGYEMSDEEQALREGTHELLLENAAKAEAEEAR